MNRPCPRTIDCPGTDSPVSNYSAEAPDPKVFTVIAFPPVPHPCLGCDPDKVYHAIGCFGIGFSASSQEEANLLARLSMAICKEPSSQQYTNDPQTATCACPGGAVFSYTVPAGYMTMAADPDPEAWLAASNAAALAYAQQQASNLEQRSCVFTTSLLPHPGWMCLGEELLPGTANTYTVTGLNSAGDWTFVISAGALPDGVTLDKTGPNTAEISGTPNMPGTYTYTILAYRAAMPNQTISMTDTLRVAGIINQFPGDGTVGTPYSQQLTTTGALLPVTFSADPLTLPDGLTMDSTGLITGTPTALTSAPFSVTITDASGGVCIQDVTVTITAGATCMTPVILPDAQYLDATYVGTLTPVVPIISEDAAWTTIAGTIPPGLDLDESVSFGQVGGIVGFYSGGATQCGTFHFTIRVVASDPPTDCFQNIQLTVVAPYAFNCGGNPTTLPAGTPWSWAGGNTGGVAQPFYTFTVCNNTCVIKHVQITWNVTNPWSTGSGGNMSTFLTVNSVGGTSYCFFPGPPPINNQTLGGVLDLQPFSVNVFVFGWQTDSGDVNPNGGTLSFAFI